MDISSRIIELARQGFECSQILAILFMEQDGMENPDVVRAMSGLNGGIGRTGGACGALTGGACAIGLFTGKGDADEPEHSRQREMLQKYAAWFEQTFPGTDCRDIIDGDYSKCLTTCSGIIEECAYKIMELFDEYEVFS